MSWLNDRRYGSPQSFETFDENKMIATVTLTNEEGDEMTKEVQCYWDVCSTCSGNGSHVNPNIDSHGISSEEFDEDPDFADSYFRGDYDVTCNECNGKRVVPSTHDKEVNEYLEDRAEEDYYDRQTMAREMGWH